MSDEELIAKLIVYGSDEDKMIAARVEQLAAINEELEDKLATCEKYKAAYAECDRIGTQAVRDLEAKLARAVEFIQEVRRNGDTRLASMAIAVLAELGETE